MPVGLPMAAAMSMTPTNSERYCPKWINWSRNVANNSAVGQHNTGNHGS